MMRERRLGFFVIGAMRSGTTSLYKYLSGHHVIHMPTEKEAPFFSDDVAYGRGLEWYMQNRFADARDGSLLGTVTPHYMMSPRTPERIRESCPDAKLIAILRDPIERAYSHYQMATRFQGEDRKFEDVVSAQLNSMYMQAARERPNYWRDYVIFGEYGRILLEFRSHFPERQLLVLFMDELAHSPGILMQKIFEFLGLENAIIPHLGKKYHETAEHPVKSAIANLIFGTRFRMLGQMLPSKTRRKARFWLGIHRHSASPDLDTSFRLSVAVRGRLEDHYRRDADLLRKVLTPTPYWLTDWDNN